MMMSHYGKGLVNPPIEQLVNRCKRIENDSIRSICFKLLRFRNRRPRMVRIYWEKWDATYRSEEAAWQRHEPRRGSSGLPNFTLAARRNWARKCFRPDEL